MRVVEVRHVERFRSRSFTPARVQRFLPEIYLAISLFVTSCLAVLTPPFFAPDEPAHVERAIQIAHGHIIPEKLADGAGGSIDANEVDVARRMGDAREDLDAHYGPAIMRLDDRLPLAQFASLRKVYWFGHSVETTFTNTAVYPPVFYLPSALGWRIGEAAAISIFHSLLLARLLAALSAVMLGWTALRLAGGARWLLFAYLLLPTSLSLSASCSQDAFLYVAAGLAFVLVWRAIQAHRAMSATELAFATLLLLSCCLARAPYLPLVVALPAAFLETDAPRRSMWKAVLGATVVLVAVVLWEGRMKMFGYFHLSGIDPAKQILFLEGHPLSGALHIAVGTLRTVPGIITRGLEQLGAGDVLPARWMYHLLELSLVAMVWSSPRIGMARRSARLLVAAGLLLVVALISAVEYVIWTPTGAAGVAGLQPRYYIPLLLFALLLWPLKPKAITREGTGAETSAAKNWTLLLSTATFAGLVLYTPWIAAQRFYGDGLLQALRGSLR